MTESSINVQLNEQVSKYHKKNFKIQARYVNDRYQYRPVNFSKENFSNMTAHILFRDMAHRIYQGVPPFQSAIRFHGTHTRNLFDTRRK